MCTYNAISSHIDHFEIQKRDSEESLLTFVNLFLFRYKLIFIKGKFEEYCSDTYWMKLTLNKRIGTDSNYGREDFLWLQKNKCFHFVRKNLV